MKIREHLKIIFQINPGFSPNPFPKMVLCGVATTLPLIVGHYRGELGHSIFGSLLGLALTLNDHMGPITKRILHLMVTSFFLILGYFVGAELSDNFNFLLGLIFVLAFLLGKTKNKGVELERMLLFTTLNILTLGGIHGFKGIMHIGATYAAFTYVLYSITLVLLYVLKPHDLYLVESKRKILSGALRENRSLYFAFVFAIFTCLGYFISKKFQFDREYWVVGTTLIIMLPDRHQTYHKAIQRLIGTIIGVILTLPLTQYTHHFVALIIFSAIFAILIPVGMQKNFMIGNIFIAGFVLILLELTRSNGLTLNQLAVLRIQDIALGGGIGIVGAVIANLKIKSLQSFQHHH